MMYSNYQHSLTAEQQRAIQVCLRLLPMEYRGAAWELLHELTYSNDWTRDQAKYLVPVEKGIPRTTRVPPAEKPSPSARP
jgi:hypothetical protein